MSTGGGAPQPRPELGAVLTATELEGCSPAADWSRRIARGQAPDSGRGGPALPFPRSWAEDLEQLASLGVDTVLLTLEWAELEPRPGHHPPRAVELRRDLLRGAAELGLRPWACLVDRTLPGWFADDEGGFGDDRSRGLTWPRHIDWIGETFGDLVAGWVPQREPLLQVLRRHRPGATPRGRPDRSPDRDQDRGHRGATAARAARDAVLADGEAWRLLRGTAPVATYQTARLVVPDPGDPTSRPRAAAVERLLSWPWIGALTEGRLLAGDLPERAVGHLRDAFDRVVVQLRPSIRVDGEGRWLPHPADRRPGPTGLVAHPEALAEALARVTGELDGRPVVAASDLADVVDDGGARRPSSARADHEQILLGLVAEHGLAGFWQASPIDGYHFEHGFDVHPGLITADRTETAAAQKFREAAAGRSRPVPAGPGPDPNRDTPRREDSR